MKTDTPIQEAPRQDGAAVPGTRRRGRPKPQAEPIVASLGVMQITEKAIKAITAKRFETARKISGLDQTKAALLLGYSNSSQLSKIESGISGVKTYVIQRAALVYGVSMDYLTGLSSYPERDHGTVEQVALMRWVRQSMAQHALSLTKQMLDTAGTALPITAHLSKIRNLVGELYRTQLVADKTGSEADKAAFRQAIESLVDAAEDAEVYLKRRQTVRAHEYMDGVEQEYPLLALLERGLEGTLDAQDEVRSEQMALTL